MVKFIKPIPVIKVDTSNDLGFGELKNIKVYKNGVMDLETDEERRVNDKNKELWNKFKNEVLSHVHDVVGYAQDFEGNKLNDIYLRDILDYCTYESERYINTWTFTRDADIRRNYSIFRGVKKYKHKNNHLHGWLSKDFINENFNDTRIPQNLDDNGYVTLPKDSKTSAIVSYGYENDLQRQELKDVYVSAKGRYIKYRGKNYYIREEE